MLNRKNLIKTVGAGAAMLLLTCAQVYAADDASRTQSSGNGAAATGGSSSNGAAAAGNVTARSATVSDDDQGRMKNIAEANYAEIRTGKMALEKSKNSQIRQFAQMMISDHTKANAELQKLAQSKNVTLPQETDIQHKAAATGMNVLSGNAFDKAYINFVGQADHQRTIQLLEDTMNNARDPDLRAYAQKTLQTVRQHKQKADAIEQQMKARS